MFALDFKLTSAQVKVLLQEWHGHHFADQKPRPARDLFDSAMRSTVRKTLLGKGLLELVNPNERWQDFAEMRITPMGTALAETIVLQAQKILSLDASRREFIAELPDIKEQWAEATKLPPIEVEVRRRTRPEARDDE